MICNPFILIEFIKCILDKMKEEDKKETKKDIPLLIKEAILRSHRNQTMELMKPYVVREVVEFGLYTLVLKSGYSMALYHSYISIMFENYDLEYELKDEYYYCRTLDTRIRYVELSNLPF
jgi:hypothetical protein